MQAFGESAARVVDDDSDFDTGDVEADGWSGAGEVFAKE